MKKIKKSQQGFSFLEALISMVIIAIGLLGLSGLQITSLKGTANAHSRNVATMLIMELGDRMRANPLGVSGAFYDNNVNCEKLEKICRGLNECSAEAVARYDVQEIMCGTRTRVASKSNRREGGVKNSLPSGVLSISCVGSCGATNTVHNITIGWRETFVHKAQSENNQDLDKPFKELTITIPVIP